MPGPIIPGGLDGFIVIRGLAGPVFAGFSAWTHCFTNTERPTFRSIAGWILYSVLTNEETSMSSTKLAFAVVLGAVVSATGCRSTTSNRVAYPTQPAIVTAAPAPPCATPVAVAPVAVGTVPPPPAGFVR